MTTRTKSAYVCVLEVVNNCLKNFSGGGKCPGGICPRGVIVRGVFVRG